MNCWLGPNGDCIGGGHPQAEMSTGCQLPFETISGCKNHSRQTKKCPITSKTVPISGSASHLFLRYSLE